MGLGGAYVSAMSETDTPVRPGNGGTVRPTDDPIPCVRDAPINTDPWPGVSRGGAKESHRHLRSGATDTARGTVVREAVELARDCGETIRVRYTCGSLSAHIYVESRTTADSVAMNAAVDGWDVTRKKWDDNHTRPWKVILRKPDSGRDARTQ